MILPSVDTFAVMLDSIITDSILSQANAILTSFMGTSQDSLILTSTEAPLASIATPTTRSMRPAVGPILTNVPNALATSTLLLNSQLTTAAAYSSSQGPDSQIILVISISLGSLALITLAILIAIPIARAHRRRRIQRSILPQHKHDNDHKIRDTGSYNIIKSICQTRRSSKKPHIDKSTIRPMTRMIHSFPSPPGYAVVLSPSVSPGTREKPSVDWADLPISRTRAGKRPAQKRGGHSKQSQLDPTRSYDRTPLPAAPDAQQKALRSPPPASLTALPVPPRLPVLPLPPTLPTSATLPLNKRWERTLLGQIAEEHDFQYPFDLSGSLALSTPLAMDQRPLSPLSPLKTPTRIRPRLPHVGPPSPLTLQPGHGPPARAAPSRAAPSQQTGQAYYRVEHERPLRCHAWGQRWQRVTRPQSPPDDLLARADIPRYPAVSSTAINAVDRPSMGDFQARHYAQAGCYRVEGGQPAPAPAPVPRPPESAMSASRHTGAYCQAPRQPVPTVTFRLRTGPRSTPTQSSPALCPSTSPRENAQASADPAGTPLCPTAAGHETLGPGAGVGAFMSWFDGDSDPESGL